MAYPTTIDDLPNVSNGRVTTTIEVPHAANHNSANQAIERIEGYVGVSASEDTGTITGKIKQNAANIQSHISSTSNPHSVTAAQAGAVAINTPITGATKTKITYDAKGLVTSGADLASSDLPIATSSTVGAVKPDGTRITIDENGVITTAGSGTGDVVGPATNTADYIPQWNGANSNTLKDGLAVPEGGLAGLTALGLKEDTANKVTAFQETPDDTHYISEKLAKDSLDAKEPTLPATPTNPETKFLNGNRLWSEVLVGSGGYASNLYLTNVTSTIIGTYKQVSYTNDASETSVATTANANEVLAATYLFEQAAGITTIDSGTWRANMYAAIDAAAGDTYLKFEVFTRASGGAETTLFSQYSGTIENRVGEEGYLRIVIESVQPQFTILATDKLGVRIYVKTTAAGDRTVTYKVGDGNASYVNTPLALRHTQLRGLNEDSNYQHITSTEKSTYAGKQDALVSGTNIKTVGSNSLLGSGDIPFPVSVSVTTKGDLQTHDGTDPARLPVGTNGQVLVARSGETTGLKWENPTGGGADILGVQVFS